MRPPLRRLGRPTIVGAQGDGAEAEVIELPPQELHPDPQIELRLAQAPEARVSATAGRNRGLVSWQLRLLHHEPGRVRHDLHKADGPLRAHGPWSPLRLLFYDRHDISDRKSTRLNSSHSQISYAVFC